METSAFGTEPKFQAKGVEPDLDGDGKVTFPEALPDADFLLAATNEFVKYAKELDAAAKKWNPTLEDAFTAVVVMTPTMSEYFDAWKNSRFIAGNDAEEKGFVATSRLSDIRDILGGLVLIYDSIKPAIDEVDQAQADQTKVQLQELHQFAERLFNEEQGGKKFTASEADTLGSEAQTQGGGDRRAGVAVRRAAEPQAGGLTACAAGSSCLRRSAVVASTPARAAELTPEPGRRPRQPAALRRPDRARAVRPRRRRHRRQAGARRLQR